MINVFTRVDFDELVFSLAFTNGFEIFSSVGKLYDPSRQVLHVYVYASPELSIKLISAISASGWILLSEISSPYP